MRLIHLTDPHLSTLDGLTFMGLRGKRRSGYLSWLKNRRHIHRREVLDQLTVAVRAHQPDLVLLSGDLVHIGLEREMIEAAEWLRRLGPPEKVMFVPGNHDNYARDSLSYMYRHWGSYLPAEGARNADYTSGYPLIRDLEQIKLIGVNTSCVTRVFSAAGELGAGQRERLADELKKETGDTRFHCLLIHHPPFPDMTQRRKALRDSVGLRAIVNQHAPQLVLYGHIHSNREHIFDSTRIFCTASASGINNASYRIFDLEEKSSAWDCRMRLMTLENGTGDYPSFTVSAQSRWQTPVCGSRARTELQ